MNVCRAVIGVFALTAAVLLPASTHAGEPELDVAALVAEVDQRRISEHIAAIDEPRSIFDAEIAQLHATTDYLFTELGDLGYDVERDEVRFQGRWRNADHDVTSDNLIAIKEGFQCAERIFVVGAHYDSVPGSPGADDDASGTAGMLEIARVLADVDLPATVWFTGFTMEEPGLVGSQKMARDAAANDAEIAGMMSLEMIGFTDPAIGSEFIVVIGNDASAPLLNAVEQAKSYVPDLPIVALTAAGNGESSPDTRRSDHAPFWDAGYQALLVTDTANFRNPNYHQPSDTLDTLDLPFATNVTKAMLATTVLHLTRDDDNDGEADVCTAPLAATATPAASPAVSATPPAQPTATPSRAGVTLPDTGSGGSSNGNWFVVGGSLAAATALLVGGWIALKRRAA